MISGGNRKPVNAELDDGNRTGTVRPHPATLTGRRDLALMQQNRVQYLHRGRRGDRRVSDCSRDEVDAVTLMLMLKRRSMMNGLDGEGSADAVLLQL